MDIGRMVPNSSGTPSPGDVDSDDTLTSANLSQQRMLYVTVEHNEDSYPFHQSRVSPLDPNLNSAQFSPNIQNASLLNHAHRDITSHNTNLRFTNPNEQLTNIVAEHFSQSNSRSHEIDAFNKTLTQNGHLLDNAHFSTHGNNILTPEASRTIYNYVNSLGEIDTNLVPSGSSLVEFHNPESSLEQMQQIPSDFINVDTSVTDTLTSSAYITNLNSSFILKQNVNGKYYQQALNSDIVHLPETMQNNIIITENTINGRLSDDVLTDLHDNYVLSDNSDGVISIQDNINRNDLTRFMNNQMIVNHVNSNKNHKIFKQNGVKNIKNVNSLKKYNIDLNISKNKKYMIKNAVFSVNSQVTAKKSLNIKREVLRNPLLEESGMESVTINTETGLSDTFVTTTNLYDTQTNFDFPDDEDNCSIAPIDRNGCVIGETENNTDYLVLDGGLYALNGFKTQGFFVEQTSGDVMVCQEIDSGLAIDHSMSDSKFNQLLNQDLNLSLNYNDQLILDNSDERFGTENGLIEKDEINTNENEVNSLNVNVNIGRDITHTSDIRDVDLGTNIPGGNEPVSCKINYKDEDNSSDCHQLKLQSTAIVPGDSVETLDNLRRSTRNQRVPVKNEKKDIFTICDKQVPSRAWASLPASYLIINKINIENEDAFGVFTRKTIPSRTQFGPVEGVKVTLPKPIDIDAFNYQITSDNEIYLLDVSDEDTSNWMRFVRPADSYMSQNLVMTEEAGCLYFTTIKSIGPKSELRVWYGEEYAKEYGYKLLEPSDEEKKALTDLEYSWNCFECNQRFKSSEMLHKHMNIHDDQKINSDEKNKRLARSRRARSVLTKKFHIYKIDPEITPSKHTCYICNIVFPRRNSLNRHLFKHQDDKVNKENCTYTSDNEEQYKENKNVPINKIEEMSVNGDMKKNIDSKIAINNDVIIKEVSFENPKTTVIIKSKEDKKMYKCPECPKSFVIQDRLERHLMIHQEDAESYKQFQCSHCSKKFMNSSALLCHEKTHQTLKCPMCDEIFNLVPALREHVKVHCIDGFFTCSHCKKQFTKYSVIRKHIRAFHSERKLPCPQCAKPFPTKDKLRMHLLRHSNHREFLCAQCGEQFKRKDKLQGHMKKVHAPKSMHTDNKSQQSDADASKLKKQKTKRFMPKVSPSDYHRFIYKCHSCLLGFKRRGMLVNHLAKRHPDIRPDSVPELNLPILRTTRDYYCQYCLKVYKSSSKRKAHILKNHPGQELPLSNRHKGGIPDIPGVPNPTFSQTVGSVTTHPHACLWCHKQYASKAKLLQHQRKKHADLLNTMQQINDNLSSDVQQNINDELYLVSDNDNQDEYFKIVAPNQLSVNHEQSNMNLTSSSNDDMDFELNPDDPDVINKISEPKSQYLATIDAVDKNELLASAINEKNGFENEVMQPFDKLYEDDKIVKMSQHNGENKIIINVSELEGYHKLSDKPSNLLKSLLTVPELIPIKVENELNKPSKKWVNNFPFSPYTPR